MSSGSLRTKNEIRRLIRDLNQAWLNRHFEDLERYLHPDVVMVQPGFEEQLKGRKSCIKSYEQFMAHSVVEKYKESGHSVDSWRNVAVASYHFDISYETRGKKYHDVGHDLCARSRQIELARRLANNTA